MLKTICDSSRKAACRAADEVDAWGRAYLIDVCLWHVSEEVEVAELVRVEIILFDREEVSIEVVFVVSEELQHFQMNHLPLEDQRDAVLIRPRVDLSQHAVRREILREAVKEFHPRDRPVFVGVHARYQSVYLRVAHPVCLGRKGIDRSIGSSIRGRNKN